jgi:hypothetical protein
VTGDPIDRAVALHAEAGRRRIAADVPGALAAARRSVALFAKHEGPWHPDVAAALLEVGAALELADRWREAHVAYARADRLLARYARRHNPDIRRLRIKAARALCGVCRALGRYAEGNVHGRRAVTTLCPRLKRAEGFLQHSKSARQESVRKRTTRFQA